MKPLVHGFTSSPGSRSDRRDGAFVGGHRASVLAKCQFCYGRRDYNGSCRQAFLARASSYRSSLLGEMTGQVAGLSAASVRDLVRTELRDCGSNGSPVPLEPLILDASAYEELFVSARRLLGLLYRAYVHSRTSEVPYAEVHARRMSAQAGLFSSDEFENRYATSMARPDVILSGARPRFIEFNVGAAFGGAVEGHLLTRLWKRLLDRENLALVGEDPLEVRTQFLARACEDLGTDRYVLVLGSVADVGGAESDRYFELECETLRRAGVRAEFVEPDRLAEKLGTSRRAGKTPLGLRRFTLDEWRDRGVDLRPLVNAMDSGFHLIPSQTATHLSDKTLLAFLSQGQPWMSAAEREFVTRHVPWTRLMNDQVTEWRGTMRRLRDILVSEAHSFVLKPARGMMGHGVVIGADCPTRLWADAVIERLVGGAWIAQEYVEPDVHFLAVAGADAEARTIPVSCVLSPMIIGGRRAGCWIRYEPAGRSRLVSVNGAGSAENVALICRTR